MGIKAIEDINRRISSGLSDLKCGRMSNEIIHLKGKNIDAVMYTIEKANNDLMFLSESLARKGYSDKSMMGRLKQAFEGLFGGF